MKRRDLIILFFLAELVLVSVAWFQTAPGYMDADYYMAGGLQFLRGNADVEPYLWNYLGGSKKLPIESFQYWMPLTALISSFGMLVLNTNSFAAARLFLMLLAGLVAPLTALLAYRYGNNRRNAWFAGLLALLPGFYLVFLPTTDAFGIYMVVGGVLLIILEYLSVNNFLWMSLGAGLCAGSLHMARADGLLWFFFAGLTFILYGIVKKVHLSRIAAAGVLILFGYLFIAAPWYWRNINAFGTIFPPGTSKTLWLTDYDELFSYNIAQLSIQSWLQTGWGEIIRVRIWALGQNLQTFLAVQGSIFLLPLILIGGWKLRHRLSVQVGFLYWTVLFLAFSIFLPFPGVRGSFFHSGSSVQVLFWAVTPIGLDTLIQFGVAKRNWKIPQARSIFQAGTIFLAFSLTFFLATSRLISDGDLPWAETYNRYSSAGKYLHSFTLHENAPIMVNNPPGYHLATGQPAIVIPGDGLNAIFQAAHFYQARYLLLEPGANFPELYLGEIELENLRLIAEVDSIQIFEINTGGVQ